MDLIAQARQEHDEPAPSTKTARITAPGGVPARTPALPRRPAARPEHRRAEP